LFRKKVLRELKKLEKCDITAIQQQSICGDPDYIVCINGWCIYLELKKDAKSKPRPLQAHKLKRGIRAGAISLVGFPENWTDIFTFLQSLEERERCQLPLSLKTFETQRSLEPIVNY
jgi:hypothetical protein